MNKEKISEAVGAISDRHIGEAAEYNAKRNMGKFIAIASSAAVVAIVFAVTALLGNSQSQPLLSETDSAKPPVASTAEPSQNDIHINRDDLMMAVADMDIQIEWYDVNALGSEVSDSFEGRVGVSYEDFVARLPEGYSVTDLWSYLTRWDENGVRHEEYSPYDYRLHITTPSEGTVSMAVCGVAKPLRDCIIKCDNDVPSYIKGIEMYIYGFGSEYYVFFESGGIWYDIEAETESEEELIGLIEALI